MFDNPRKIIIPGLLSAPPWTSKPYRERSVDHTLSVNEYNHMQEFQINNIKIYLNKQGSRQYSRASYPIRYGRYSEIQTPEYIYQFNLNCKLKYMHGRGNNWQPEDWLKRTAANGWVYYTAGEYSNILTCTGEYYLPCFPYPGNSIFPYKPFETDAVNSAIRAFGNFIDSIAGLIKEARPRGIRNFLRDILNNNQAEQSEKQKSLHDIIISEINVLPPDTRHSDYDIIPVIIADGCLYNCGFCNFKTGGEFQVRSGEDIDRQISELKTFYKDDLENYNSVFLGSHDSLYAGIDLIEYAALKSYKAFKLAHSYMKGANLFLFGSVYSFLKADEALFNTLNNLPFYSYINIGLESADQASLNMLEKPVKEKDVTEAYYKLIEINKKYDSIEVTANFILSSRLPVTHYNSIAELTGNYPDRNYPKGCIYLSPMIDEPGKINMRKDFTNLKTVSRLPAYLYIIQCL